MILEGKRILVTGVMTKTSIAHSVAAQAQEAGAEVLLTSFGRARRMTERAAKSLPKTPDVLELDVNKEEDFEGVVNDIRERWGGLDGALHAIAFAPEEALGGDILRASAESATTAFQTSAFSLKSLAAALLPLMEEGDGEPGGSIVGLDFDASVAWPVYDWMGVAKAALESLSRYLARDLGPHGVRVNLVSAGPIKTAAASGIPGFELLAGAWNRQSPLKWDTKDPVPVAQTVCFLLSDWSRAITGEIIHVDGGFHAMGTALPEPAASDEDGDDEAPADSEAEQSD
ncbi:MAG: enoyl-ACP reductase FabI [Solirubrobacteraceae bacterium]